MASNGSQMKKLVPLAIAFAILVGAAVVVKLCRGPAQDIGEEAGVVALPSGPFSATDAARVEIDAAAPAPAPAAKPEDAKKPGGDDKVVLVRDGESWRIDSYYGAPADAEKVRGFLDKVKDLGGELRSQDAAVLADYGLGADQAVHVRVLAPADKLLLHVLAGKRGKHNTSFVRRDGENTVYEVNVNVRNEVGVFGDDAKTPLPQNHWLDRVVCKLEKDRIRKIALKWPERTLTLEKRALPEKKEGDKKAGDKPAGDSAPPKMEWQAVDGTMGLDYKSTATEGLLSALSRWDATDVADPSKAAELRIGDASPWRCEVTFEDGRALVARGAIGADPGDRVVAVSTRDKVLYKLSSWQFERVFSRGDQLFTIPAPAIEKDKLKRIATRDAAGERAYEKGADGKWKLVAPDTGHPLQSGGADEIVTALTTMKPADVVVEGDAAARGLEPAERTVTVTTDDGKSRLVKLGKTGKAAEGPYAVLDPEKPLVTVVAKHAVDSLFPEWTKLVEARVFPGVNEGDVVEITLRGTGSDVAARKADGKWRVTTKDGEQEGRADAIEAWARRVTGLDATEIQAEAGPQAKAAAEIVVKAGAGEPVTLKVGESADGKRSVWRADRRLKFVVMDNATSGLILDPATLKAPPPEPPKSGEKAGNTPAPPPAAPGKR